MEWVPLCLLRYIICWHKVLTILVSRRDHWRGVGVVGLTLFGFFSMIGALGEPILIEIFKPATFNLFQALIYAGMILVPFLTLIFGIRAWLRWRHEQVG